MQVAAFGGLLPAAELMLQQIRTGYKTMKEFDRFSKKYSLIPKSVKADTLIIQIFLSHGSRQSFSKRFHTFELLSI